MNQVNNKDMAVKEIVKSANSLTEKKKFQQAISILETASTTYPDYPYIWGNLGIAYMQSGKIDHAIEAYRKALKIDPSIDSFHLYLSMALKRKRHIFEALEEATTACELNPDNPEALYQLGCLQKESKAFHAGLITLEKALALNPSHTLAMEASGMGHLYLGDYLEARRMLQAAIQHNPRDRHPWIGISIVEFATGHWISSLRSLIKYAFGV